MSETAIAGYDRDSDTMYINSTFKSEKAILDFVKKTPGYFARTDILAPYLHELGHKYHYGIVQTIVDKQGIAYNKAKDIFDGEIREYIVNAISHSKKYLSREISIYADKMFSKGKGMNEVLAEYFTIRNKNSELITFISKNIRRRLGETNKEDD